MARYRMDDGVIVDTKSALQAWEEDADWDGSNHISKATGSQWDHEELYKSRKGRYYLRRWSNRDRTPESAEWIEPADAARWLLHNDHELPSDLLHLADEVME